jgi:hypothetical protein
MEHPMSLDLDSIGSNSGHYTFARNFGSLPLQAARLDPPGLPMQTDANCFAEERPGLSQNREFFDPALGLARCGTNSNMGGFLRGKLGLFVMERVVSCRTEKEAFRRCRSHGGPCSLA